MWTVFKELRRRRASTKRADKSRKLLIEQLETRVFLTDNVPYISGSRGQVSSPRLPLTNSLHSNELVHIHSTGGKELSCGPTRSHERCIFQERLRGRRCFQRR